MIDEERSLELFGCQRRGVLKRILKDNQVRYLTGAGGCVVTTRESLNEAMGLMPSIDTVLEAVERARQPGSIDFEIISAGGGSGSH